jgi:cellulose synthase/poly-beta-1,6-N-acetylglucosamine synthase-like glycosyltransferase
MSLPTFAGFLLSIFLIIAWIITMYNLNFYYLSYCSERNRRWRKRSFKVSDRALFRELPLVTVQLPLYNEKYVASRLIKAVCRMDYPKEKLEIQVLDDSQDDSIELTRKVVKEYLQRGFDINYIHRNDRVGFKAGALKVGTQSAKGEFIAIFDADFIPPPEFIKQSLIYFSDYRIGLVQCRWGHINENYSTLTEAQAFSLDLHFFIEQNAKSFTHLFMNFNGTAGIWRTSCINDAGGWQEGTLVEDLDLSYRAQMKGWKLLFVEEIVVSGELPVQMNAAKRQQFRWAKGSIQLAIKLLGKLLIQKKIPTDTKIQAFIQLTRHIVHPLFLAQFLIFPILLSWDDSFYNSILAASIGLLVYLLMGPVAYIYIIRRLWQDKWKLKAKQYCILLFFATGISVNNSIAVFDGLFGTKNEFLRTPKFGIVGRTDKWKNKDYVLPFTKTTLLELFLSLYGCLALFICIFSGNSIFAPVIAIQTIGFVYVSYLSIIHSSLDQKTPLFRTQDQIIDFDNSQIIYSRKVNDLNEKVITDGYRRIMTSTFYGKGAHNLGSIRSKALLIGFFTLVAVGAYIAFYGYHSTIYPLDKAIGYLSRAQSAQTPHMISNYINSVKELVPAVGNPVWTFPNPKTDFDLILKELEAIQLRTEFVSVLEPHTAAYNTALEDIHGSIKIIESNLIEAEPYLYASLSNILFSAVWIGLILCVFALIRRNKAKISKKELT